MRSLLVVCLLFLLTSNAFADNKERCGAISTWVHAVILLKVQNGLSQDQILPHLQKTQAVPTNMVPIIDSITTAVYSDEMPVIQSGADVAAVVNLFYEMCLKNEQR